MTLAQTMGARRKSPALAIALAAVAIAAAIVPTAARAADGSFAPICLGSARLGEDRAEGQVAYRFGCNTEVRGYSVLALDRQVDAFDTEPVVLDEADKPAPGEDFGCSGQIPGFGVGCGGLATMWHRVNGSLNLTTDPCKGPRPRFALTVSDAKGRTAGPYPLASTRGGPASRPLTGCPAQVARKKAHKRPSRRAARR
jgi:hypothetical protein